MLILAFLSLERFLLIAVPFSGHQKLNLSTATYSLTVIWMVGVIIAVAPGTVFSKVLVRSQEVKELDWNDNAVLVV